ncbi:MAG TPA: ice-binding family protein [Patescibacteria group bacterium]|nr:ice-binding family protein [Patescibacteria group bacterium]
MKIFKNTSKLLTTLFVVLMGFLFVSVSTTQAATSPTLSALSGYSVLGGQAVTCTGATTTTGAVGVSSGTSITGFPSPCTAGGGTQSNNASAIAAQAENLATFAALDQTCDQSFGAVDLTATFPSGVGPGVYCSTSSFSLSGNLNLTGSGVWIFKTVSTLITSPGSSITGGDACNLWWRVGSSVTLDTTTAFKGNILALNGVNAMNTGATLDGRLLAQDAGTVTLAGNTITGPTCGTASSTLTSPGGPSTAFCPPLSSQIMPPAILSSRRVDSDSIFISWGPYSGTNTFNVRYGTTNGNWLYNVDVTGFSTTINNLPANTPIWVEVAARNDCRIGVYGAATFVGGPGLPNTGFAPQDVNVQLYISAGILVTVLALLKFSLKA